MSDVSSTSSTVYTGMSGAGGGDLIRLTGMATGLDVDGMVKKMMAAEQVKVDKVKQEQQLIQWKQAAYQDIIKDIKDLQSAFFDPLNSANNLLSSSSYAGHDVVIPDDYKAVISVTAGTGAVNGNYSISFAAGSNGAGQLAVAAGMTSSDALQVTSKTASAAAKLSDLGVTTDGSFDITYNNGQGIITKTITFTKDTTLASLANSINTVTSNGVCASYSELTGKFTIQTAQTGANTTLTLNNPTGDTNVLNDLKLTSSITGLDAKVYITPPGGTPTFYTNSSNNFTLDGVSYSLIGKTDSTFSITQNTQAVHDKIKSFLDKYNAVIDKIQTKLNEKKDYGYPPLTDTQKSSMKDADITSWNAKAQQGILRNDDNLQNLLNQLRSAFVTPLTDSTSKNITGVYFGNRGDGAIGIDTSDDSSQGAKITIVDDTKLNNAIQNHSADILKLFTNISTADQSTAAGKIQYFNESGIMQRFDDILKSNVGYAGTTLNNAILTQYANMQDDYSISGQASSNTLPDQIYYKQIIINKMNDDLKTKQEKYYQQFSQLETAMNELNNQQAQLTSMLGG